jgi:phosphate-selective porin OprO and OprP
MKKQWLVFLTVLFISPVIFSSGLGDGKFPLAVSYTPMGINFSADNGFSTTLTGFIQADAMKFEQNNQELASGTNIRRARLYLTGSLNPDWGYNFAYDFRSNDLLLACVNYSGLKNMQFSLGQIFPDFGLVNTTSPMALHTMELPLPVIAFSPPYFSMGLGYNVWNDFLTLQLAAFGPSSSQTVTRRNPLGATARAVYSPIHTETKALNFGLSGWVQRPDGSNTVTFNPVPEIKSFNAETIVNTENIGSVNSYGTVGAEAAAIYGPLAIMTEYLQMRVNRGDNNPNLKFSGYYVTGSYFLTGESLGYSYPNADLGAPIDVRDKKMGAWELLGRYSSINLNDTGVSGGKENNITAGLNWYMNPHIKWMLNYVHARAKPGSNREHDNVNIVGARLQLIF